MFYRRRILKFTFSFNTTKPPMILSVVIMKTQQVSRIRPPTELKSISTDALIGPALNKRKIIVKRNNSLSSSFASFPIIVTYRIKNSQ